MNQTLKEYLEQLIESPAATKELRTLAEAFKEMDERFEVQMHLRNAEESYWEDVYAIEQILFKSNESENQA